MMNDPNFLKGITTKAEVIAPTELQNEVVNETSFDDLNNVNFKKEEVKEEVKIKEVKIKMNKKSKLIIDDDANDDEEGLFSDNPTVLCGKNKLVLIQKIKKYKALFKTELKGFKICKDQTEEQLNECIDEIQIKLQLGSIDGFILEGILQSLTYVETMSSKTKYNITGLSNLLKSNPQFNSLAKQLAMKYNKVSQIPVEIQLLLCVGGGAYMCVLSNQNKPNIPPPSNQSVNDFLNQKV
jgi:hypothetical protein